MAQIKKAAKPKQVRLTKEIRDTLLGEHVHEITSAGYAIDLPSSYLPKHLRFSTKVKSWRDEQSAKAT